MHLFATESFSERLLNKHILLWVVLALQTMTFTGRSWLVPGTTLILVTKRFKSSTSWRWTSCPQTLLSLKSRSAPIQKESQPVLVPLERTTSFANLQLTRMILVSGQLTSLKATTSAKVQQLTMDLVLTMFVMATHIHRSFKKLKTLSVGKRLMMMTTKMIFGALTLVTKIPGVRTNARRSFVQSGETLTPWTLLKICPSLVLQALQI